MTATTIFHATPESSWLLLLGLLAMLWTAGWVGWHLAMLRVERARHAVLRPQAEHELRLWADEFGIGTDEEVMS